MWETQVWSLGWEDPLEEGMATYSSILAWNSPWSEPGGLQSMESQRVRHNWETNINTGKELQFGTYHLGGPPVNLLKEGEGESESPSVASDCDLMDYTVHGILQARILEWIAVPFSRAPSQPRTQISRIAGGFFTSWATREAQAKEREFFYRRDMEIGRDSYKACWRKLGVPNMVTFNDWVVRISHWLSCCQERRKIFLLLLVLVVLLPAGDLYWFFLLGCVLSVKYSPFCPPQSILVRFPLINFHISPFGSRSFPKSIPDQDSGFFVFFN